MQPLRIVSALGSISRLYSFVMLIPFLVALAYEPWDTSVFGWFDLPRNALVFLFSAALVAFLWIPVLMFTRNVEDEEMQDKEAYLTVALGWVVLSVFSALPFIFSGVIGDPVDAFFESMSGLTTTGATILSGQLEELPKSVMFWRSGLQYIGGMGIVVLSVAVLARLTQGGIQLLQAEAPGPSVTRIRPKLAQTAKTLWLVYAYFSLALVTILYLLMRFQQGMPSGEAIYDAILHTFSTLSTGGFSNHTASIAYYDSWIIEVVLILFMLVAGSNFTLHYHWQHGHFRRLFGDPEWRLFILGVPTIILVASGLLWDAGASFMDGLRSAAFTVASIATSTGYATVDYDAWPDAGKLLLIILMLTGGTAGSTAGGMKIIRIMILMKVVRREIRKLLHPRAVIPIRVAGKPLKENTVMAAIAFFFSFITIWMIGTGFLVTAEPQLHLVDGAVASASMMGNTGPAMGVVGPTDNYAELMPSSKVVMAALMWIGRLEVFTALLLLNPASWKN